MKTDNPDARLWRRLRAGASVALAALIVGIGGLFALRIVRLKRERRRLMQEQGQGPLVQYALVTRTQPGRTLTLIGEARPFAEVTLYAKVSGYLRRLRADKGQRVRKGEILAVIESPETDRDYQAALANARNLEAIARRYPPLLAKSFVSQQEADQAFANAAVARAQADALRVIKGYEQLRTPFDGTVTARYADEGALIQNAQAGASGALPVFTVSDTTRLRVFVYVDQADAALVRVGAPAVLSSQERPDLKVTGQVARVAGELDERTRTLLAEIDVSNEPPVFVPGSFLACAMTLTAPSFLTIPEEALVIAQGKTLAAVVGPDGTLEYRPIAIGQNDGVNVEVLSGLKEGERVAVNVGQSVSAGTPVRLSGQPAGPSGYGTGGKGGQGAQSGGGEGQPPMKTPSRQEPKKPRGPGE